MNEKIKAFLFYMVTEPFKVIVGGTKEVPKSLAQPRIWLVIFTTALFIEIILQDRRGQIISLVLVLVMYGWKEWDEGHFWKKWKDKKYGHILKNKTK